MSNGSSSRGCRACPRRARSCTRATCGRSRPAEAPSSRASWRCSRAGASSSRRSGATTSVAPPSAGWPGSASTCTCSGAARPGGPGRTSTVRASERSPCSATSCCLTDRCRSTATTSSSSSRASPACSGRLAAARFLAATARELPTLRAAGVPLDLLVGSLNDAGERYDGSLEAGTVVLTDGANGGTANGVPYAAVQAETVVDTYGAGDSFAAALAFALARGDPVEQALELAARAGSAVIGGSGPYAAQTRWRPVSGRVAWISLAPVKATAAAARRRGRGARDRSPGRPPLLLHRRVGPPDQQQGLRPAAARAGGVRRARRRAAAAPARRCGRRRSGRARGGAGDALPLARAWARGSCAAPGRRRSRASWASACGSSSPRTERPIAAGRARRRCSGRARSRRSRAVLGVDQVDGRRFRMNFGIDGLEPHAEDDWLGRRVRSERRSSSRRGTSAAASSPPRAPTPAAPISTR